MAIIVVGGSNQGVGKTSLVCGILAALPEYRWAAIKITTHEHPQTVSSAHHNTVGVAPSEIASIPRNSSFRNFFDKRLSARFAKSDPAIDTRAIWEETRAGEETDTARYLAAGAARAILVSAPDGDLSDPLNQLWPRFGRGSNIIFESNSVVHHVRPDACLLIHATAERALPLPERKPSFLAAVRYADAMVSHARTNELIPNGLSLAPNETEIKQPKPIFHLASLEKISPELLAWLRLRLAPLLQAEP